MGDFDWYGTGQALGRVGQALLEERERKRREEERQQIIRLREEEARARRAQARLEAARNALAAAQAVATSPDDQALQRALKEYEDALREVGGPSIELPKETRPAKIDLAGPGPQKQMQLPQETPTKPQMGTPTVRYRAEIKPRPLTFREVARGAGIVLTPEQDKLFGDRPAEYVLELNARSGGQLIPGLTLRNSITFRDYARHVGLQLTPEQDAAFGDRPASEVLDLNERSAQAGRPIFPGLSKKDTEATDRAIRMVDFWTQRIFSAQTEAERQAAAQHANTWRAQAIAQHPELAKIIPDFGDMAKRATAEAQAAQRAQEAAKVQSEWKNGFERAMQRLREAQKGADEYELRIAIAEVNSFITEGRKRGYTNMNLIDTNSLVREWRAARAREFRKQELEMRALERRATGGDEKRETPVQVSSIGPYRVVHQYDRRGNFTKQVIVDTRTGVVVSDETLRARASQGDQAAAAILGYQPKGQATDPRSMTDTDIKEELDWIDLKLVDPNTKPDEKRSLRQRRDQLVREQQRRMPPARSNVRVPSPTVRAIYQAWQRTKEPVPARVWMRLSPDEVAWLVSAGVKLEGR